jgi:formamidopyrimidine-DNA glycosylase
MRCIGDTWSEEDQYRVYRVVELLGRGKQLFVKLQNDQTGKPYVLAFHMMLHGCMRWSESSLAEDQSQPALRFKCLVRAPEGEGSVARWTLWDDSLLATAVLMRVPEFTRVLSQLAPSVDDLDGAAFALAARCPKWANRAVASVLTDQHAVVSGVGKWLCATALGLCGLSGKEKMKLLAEDTMLGLHRELLRAVAFIRTELVSRLSRKDIHLLYGESVRLRRRLPQPQRQ